jgi:hypothetical protein
MSRVLSFVALLGVLVIGTIVYLKQVRAVSPASVQGSTDNPEATIDLTGVKRDLLQFAKAEQQHLAMDGKYASLDEMHSAGDSGLPDDSRGPFHYSIAVSAGSFTVTATYTGQPLRGVPARMSVGPDMNIVTE